MISEELITLGVVWRFLKIKGLPYDQQFMEYQSRVQELTQTDGARPILRMGGPNFASMPVNEPEGNFGL